MDWPLIIFSGIFLATGFWQVALVIAGFSFFWNAILPPYEVITLSHLKHQPERYSRIRVWGSIGFILMALLMGGITENLGLNSVPYGTWLVMAGMAVAAFLVSESAVPSVSIY